MHLKERKEKRKERKQERKRGQKIFWLGRKEKSQRKQNVLVD
jgi:hypothetical protein